MEETRRKAGGLRNTLEERKHTEMMDTLGEEPKRSSTADVSESSA